MSIVAFSLGKRLEKGVDGVKERVASDKQRPPLTGARTGLRGSEPDRALGGEALDLGFPTVLDLLSSVREQTSPLCPPGGSIWEELCRVIWPSTYYAGKEKPAQNLGGGGLGKGQT